MDPRAFDSLILNQQGFNTLDSVAQSDSINAMAQQTLQNIQTMQTPMPQGHIPQHVVLPIFQKQENARQTPPPVPSQEQFFVIINDQQKGPLSLEQVKGLAIADVIDETSQVWMPGMPEWTDLKTCLGQLKK